MRVEVLFVNEAGVMAETVEAPDGAAASEVLGLAGASLPAGAGLAVFGRRIEPSTKLHEGDRLEVAGALVCDPKKVRRARAESQGDVRGVPRGRRAQAPRQDCAVVCSRLVCGTENAERGPWRTTSGQTLCYNGKLLQTIPDASPLSPDAERPLPRPSVQGCGFRRP